MSTVAAERPSTSFGRQMLNKVPEVTLFWVIKIMCTPVGETAPDDRRDQTPPDVAHPA